MGNSQQPIPQNPQPSGGPPLSLRSRSALNAANFFQAEAVGVVLPVLSIFLIHAHWKYEAIGITTAIGGLGALLLQTPAGMLADRVAAPRRLFALASILTGFCFALLPLVPRTPLWIDSLLFLSGCVGTIFMPVLAGMALALAGERWLAVIMGENQSWNHAGNIVAALAGIFIVDRLGASATFYSVACVSFLAAICALLISRNELMLDRSVAADQTPRGAAKSTPVAWHIFLRERRIWILLLAVTLFHLANAPILPMTTMYVKKLGGSDGLATATVLSAQMMMVPVAWLAGKLCQVWGRKPVLLLAFWILPLRICSYALVHHAISVVWLQALDGIGAGIYGVVIVLIVADLTEGEGRFNTLLSIFATVQGIGGVVGPVISGFTLDHYGFRWSFLAYAVLAAAGAVVVSLFLTETRRSKMLSPYMSAD